jgi:hypothetical protein
LGIFRVDILFIGGKIDDVILLPFQILFKPQQFCGLPRPPMSGVEVTRKQPELGSPDFSSRGGKATMRLESPSNKLYN